MTLRHQGTYLAVCGLLWEVGDAAGPPERLRLLAGGVARLPLLGLQNIDPDQRTPTAAAERNDVGQKKKEI
jgi:hypothetical protein